MVDFPGVDDEDDSIGDLADLLLTIAQIVIFVVDYRYTYQITHACVATSLFTACNCIMV